VDNIISGSLAEIILSTGLGIVSAWFVVQYKLVTKKLNNKITYHINKRLRAEEATEDLKQYHQEQVQRIRRNKLNIEELALALEDIGVQQEAVLKVTRLDPRSMFQWRDRKTLKQEIKL
jgi:hypothetical protein